MTYGGNSVTWEIRKNTSTGVATLVVFPTWLSKRDNTATLQAFNNTGNYSPWSGQGYGGGDTEGYSKSFTQAKFYQGLNISNNFYHVFRECSQLRDCDMTNATITAQYFHYAFYNSGLTGIYSGDVTGTSNNYGYVANGASGGKTDDIYRGTGKSSKADYTGGLRFRAGTSTGMWNTTGANRAAYQFARSCKNLKAVVLKDMFRGTGGSLWLFAYSCPKLETVYLDTIGGDRFNMQNFAWSSMTDKSLYGKDTSVTLKISLTLHPMNH